MRSQTLMKLVRRKGFLLVLILIFALGIRVWFQASLPYPGTRDSYHYCSLARNIAEGRGFSVDYVWHDLIRYESIPHPDDWQQPLFVVPMAGLIGLGLNPLSAGKIVSISCGVLLVLVIYIMGRRLFDEETGIIASIIAMAYPPLLFYSSVVMTDMLFVLLSSLAILVLVTDPFEGKWSWALGGLLAGLSYLARPTGLVILVTVITAFAWSWGRKDLRKSLRTIMIVIIFFLVAASPWLIRNTLVLGGPTKSGASMRLWTMGEGDLYDYDYEKPDPIGVLSSVQTWKATGSYLLRYFEKLLSVTPFFGLALIGFLLFLLSEKDIFGKRFLTIYLCLFFFLSGFNRAGGTWVRQLLPITPLIVLFASAATLVIARTASQRVDGIMFRVGILRTPKISTRWAISGALCLMCVFFSIAWAIQVNKGRISIEEYEKEEHDAMSREISAWLVENTPNSAVVMTRHPWEINYYSMRRTVSPPNVGDRLREVASLYNTTLLVVDDWNGWPYSYGDPYLSLLEGRSVVGYKLLEVWEGASRAAIYRIEQE